MADNPVKKDDKKVPTGLIWGVATELQTPNLCHGSDYSRLVKDMYPGIENWWAQAVHLVQQGFVRDDLNTKMEECFHRKMAEFVTEQDAIAALGSHISIEHLIVRPCNLLEWQEWDQWYQKRLTARRTQTPE